MMKAYRSFFNLFFLIATLFLITSCSDNSVGPGDDSHRTQQKKEIIQYFKEIALGFEFGNQREITRRWEEDINIFVGGEQNQMLRDELDGIISELNGLISLTNVELSITADSSDSNYYIYFGEGEEYAMREPSAEGYVDSNFGLFFVSTNVSDHIISGSMYVDTHRPAVQNQLHLLREELTQSLGLAKDSGRYPYSIFYSNYSGAVTDYSTYDEALIQLLYHPQMEAGLDSVEVDSVLNQILDDESTDILS